MSTQPGQKPGAQRVQHWDWLISSRVQCLPLGEKPRAVNMMKYAWVRNEGKKEVKPLETEEGGEKILG